MPSPVWPRISPAAPAEGAQYPHSPPHSPRAGTDPSMHRHSSNPHWAPQGRPLQAQRCCPALLGQNSHGRHGTLSPGAQDTCGAWATADSPVPY